jgi:protease-4
LLNFVHKQIEKVARDPKVKAIVLRIDSPGGTITASQDLYARLLELRDGTHLKAQGVARPIIVSMGGVAASGGYYIAMASGTAEEGSYVMAEDITITGSIGVYVAMLNIAEFAQRYGIRMDLIKAGGIKASGSLFHEMSPQERQPWQDMIDNAYDKFLEIVATGRKGRLAKTDLEEVLNMPTPIKLYDSKGVPIKDADGQAKTVPYTRQRADGGIFTTKKAIELKLVDAQGTLKDAVAMAAKKAGLADSPYKAVKYERPTSLLESLLGVETRSAQTYLEPERLANLAIPRLWVMMPNAELSGLAATLR